VKVIVLHQHFKIPQRGGAIRSYYLAKALLDAGHSVRVITAGNTGYYHFEEIDDIDIHYLPVRYENSFGYAKRIKSFLSFIVEAIRRPRLYKDGELVYAISVPLTIGILALWIKRVFKIPYIFEVGDLWPQAPIQMGFVKNIIVKKFLYGLERKVYQEARSIVALSPFIQKSILERTKNTTVHLIPNMADTVFYKPSEKLKPLEKKFDTENCFVVSYIGAIGQANGLDFILYCARASQQSTMAFRFLICGDGAMLEDLKSLSEKLSLSNLRFIPFKNRDGVNEVLRVSDAVFVCYKRVPILETGSPNKYFDGLAAGKLIVINFGGWIREEIEHYQCGVYIENPDIFPKCLEPFITNPGLLSRFQQSARTLAEQKYSRTLLSEKFLSVITGKKFDRIDG
jgi:glycosyltransferase involved in cell wall biosynthesis